MRITFSMLTALFVLLLSAGEALAGNLSYQGQNPAIFAGANPGNAAALMASVSRPKNPDLLSAGAGRLSSAELVQQAVLSQVSNQIYTQIFDNANVTGNFDLGDGNAISYLRTGGNLVITITDPVNGQTIITMPDL